MRTLFHVLQVIAVLLRMTLFSTTPDSGGAPRKGIPGSSDKSLSKGLWVHASSSDGEKSRHWFFTKAGRRVTYETRDTKSFLLDAVINSIPGGRWTMLHSPWGGFTPTELARDAASVLGGVTFAYPGKGGLTSIAVYGDDGQPLPWGSLPGLGWSMASKLAKRFASLGWHTHLGLIGAKCTIIREGEPLPSTKRPGEIWVFLVEEENVLHDGRVTMSKSFLQKVIRHRAGQAKFSPSLINRWRNTVSWHIRVLTPEGIIKGDAIVGNQIHRDSRVDLVTTLDNLKKELFTTNGQAHLEMFSQESRKKIVELDRQALTFFHDVLAHYGFKGAFAAWVKRMTFNIVSGDIPEELGIVDERKRASGGTRDSYRERFEKVLASGLGIKRFPYLFLNVAEQVDNMIFDAKRPRVKMDDRRFKLPMSIRKSLRSEIDVTDTGSNPLGLSIIEASLHKVGFVVSDEMYPKIAEILGGGDKDDKVVVLPFWTAKSVTINFGDAGKHSIPADTMALFVYRQPIGTISNGKKTGVEYVILQASSDMEQRMVEMWGAADIPTIDIDAVRPPMVTEIHGTVEDGRVAALRNPPLPSSWDKRYMLDLSEAFAEAGRVYGVHANLNMAAFLMDRNSQRLHLPFYAEPSFFVDVTQQTPHIAAIDFVEEVNIAYANLIKGSVLGGGYAIPKLSIERLKGSFKRYEFGQLRQAASEMWYGELFRYHMLVQRKFKKDIKQVAHKDVLPDVKSRAKSVEITARAEDPDNPNRRIPYLLREVIVAFDALKESVENPSFKDFEETADALANEWLERAAVKSKTRAEVASLVYEAVNFRLTRLSAGVARDDAIQITALLRSTDQEFCNGMLLDLYIEGAVEHFHASHERPF